MNFTQMVINQFSQHLITEEKVYDWFDTRSAAEKKEIVRELFQMVKQAHPDNGDLLLAIEKAPVKKRCTPAVMLQNPQRPFLTFGMDIVDLPITEIRNSFLILLNLFVIADTRRKIQCGDSCSHWWHKDLSQYKTI